jgi:hypothetical protein
MNLQDGFCLRPAGAMLQSNPTSLSIVPILFMLSILSKNQASEEGRKSTHPVTNGFNPRSIA